MRSGDAVLRGKADDVEADAESGRGWFAGLARAGLIAKGASYGLVGVLAIQLAARGGGEATSREGALATLAQESFGKVVLALLAFGFAGYALWRTVQCLVVSDDSTAKEWGKRAGYIGRALIYAGLTFSTVKILFGSGGGQSQNEEARQTTATALSWPGGRWIVGLTGVAIIGAGLWNAYRGIAKRFERKWRTGEMRSTARRWGRRAGVAGHLARAVVFALIGAFLIKAGLEYDSKDAIGLDGALQKLAGAAHGPYLLGVVAAGLACYGLFCLVDARYRDLSANGGASSGRELAGHQARA